MFRFDRQLWQQFWAIAKPYWFSQEKWGALGLLLLLLFLLLVRASLLIIVIIIGGENLSALAAKDYEGFLQTLFILLGLTVVGVPLFSASTYVQFQLGLYWRRWLTDQLLNQYLDEQTFYQLSSHPEIDNPDQRIADDVRTFSQESLKFLVLFLDSLLQLVGFTSVLWSISPPLMGFLLIYSFVGTVLAAVIFGRVLIGINFEQLKKEANFRYGLVRIQENAEAIAFYEGQKSESDQAQQRFLEAYRNFQHLINWQFNLNLFQNGYQSFTFLIPGIMLAPSILSGALEIGVLTQASSAFRSIMSALALIITQFEQLSALAAAVNRLGTFVQFTALSNQLVPEGATTIDIIEDSQLAVKHLTLQTPNYQNTLVRDLSVAIPSGQSLLIVGASGVGKSSLLRAVAGLWSSGTGAIVRPEREQILFLPQRPYTILGSLRQQLLYPNSELLVTDEQLLHILQQVNLPDLATKFGGLDSVEDWLKVLSVGEQQRLAFARLFVTQPKYAILDEATSALDEKNEELLYQQLQKTAITYVSVGHRSKLLKYHQQVLEITKDKDWHLQQLSTQYS